MRLARMLVAGCGLMAAAVVGAQTTGPVRVAVYMDKGSPRTPRDMQRILKDDPRFAVRFLTAADIRDGGLAAFDVLVQGGGDSRIQSAELEGRGREAIRTFVREGGGYVGICAGAHFTVPGDARKLGILNVRVVDNEHWARGNGDVTIGFTAEGQKEIGESRDRERLQYHQGPLLMPGDEPDLPPITTLARFETEVAKKGAPHGVMQGTTAVASAPYGKGRVFVFSPHPEMTIGQEAMVTGALLWAAGGKASAEPVVASVPPARGPQVMQVGYSAQQESAPSARQQPAAVQDAPVVAAPLPLAANRSPSVAAVPVTPESCCGPITVQGGMLRKYLDSLDVDHLWQPHAFVNWETGEPVPSQGRHEPKTHCSAFAAAAAERLNIYMMRPPDHKQSLLAAAQERYFESPRGREDGWVQVNSPTEAQTRANQGQFVVLVYGYDDPRKSGHIAVVRPYVKSVKAMESDGPQTTQAGGHNFSSGTAAYSFVYHPGAWPNKVKMFAHAIDFSKPVQAPGQHDASQDLDQ